MDRLIKTFKGYDVELDQAGHIANLDRPDEFNKKLEHFWSQIEGG